MVYVNGEIAGMHQARVLVPCLCVCSCQLLLSQGNLTEFEHKLWQLNDLFR
jgi:hypothetical protein